MIGAPVSEESLTLYGSFTSSSSYSPMLYLALAGLPFSFRTVNLKIGVQNAPEYLAINRWGMRIPLKPFFAVTGVLLYYMAFVFAGKGIAELQEGGYVGTTVMEWAPRVPFLGIYPTVQSLAFQGLLAALAIFALLRIVTKPSALSRQPSE